MKLHEKQEVFEYRTPADLYPHPEPELPKRWNKDLWNNILREIGGVCPVGDQRLRIVWGGTEMKRGYIQKAEGSVPALVIKYPADVPRIRKITGYQFITPGTEDRPSFVKRLDEVPRGAFSAPVIEYVQLGALRWHFERKFTPSELVAMQMYPEPGTYQAKMYGVRGSRRYIAPMDPRGEYVGLYPLQTPEGKYFEPDRAWFGKLRENQRVTETATEGEKSVMLSRALDAIDEMERKKAEFISEQKDIIFEEAVIEAEKAPRSRVIFS